MTQFWEHFSSPTHSKRQSSASAMGRSGAAKAFPELNIGQIKAWYGLRAVPEFLRCQRHKMPEAAKNVAINGVL